MRIMFFKQPADQLGGVLRQIKSTQTVAKLKMSFQKMPFGERRQLARGIMAEDGIADVQQIDAAVEFARARLGAAMSPLGDDAQDAEGAGKERENLRGFAVFGLAQTDATIVNQ